MLCHLTNLAMLSKKSPHSVGLKFPSFTCCFLWWHYLSFFCSSTGDQFLFSSSVCLLCQESKQWHSEHQHWQPQSQQVSKMHHSMQNWIRVKQKKRVKDAFALSSSLPFLLIVLFSLLTCTSLNGFLMAVQVQHVPHTDTSSHTFAPLGLAWCSLLVAHNLPTKAIIICMMTMSFAINFLPLF